MLVGVSDQRTMLGELFITQLADISWSASGPWSSRRHYLVDRTTRIIAGSLGRSTALSGTASTRYHVLGSLDRR